MFCKGRTFSWETDHNVKRYNDAGKPMYQRCLSSIDLSSRDSQVSIDYSSGDITLHHTKQRRADVRAETFRAKSKSACREAGIDNVEDSKNKLLGEKLRTQKFLFAINRNEFLCHLLNFQVTNGIPRPAHPQGVLKRPQKI